MLNRARQLAAAIALIAIVTLVVRADAPQLRDVDGLARDLFKPAGKANVLVFVSSDCPVSNGYAPEIQRICSASLGKGVPCTLVYEDLTIDAKAVREHRDRFHYRDMAAVIDADRKIAQRTGVTVTPEAVVLGVGGAVKYRGRINNQYVALGKARQIVTVHDLRDAIDAVVAGRSIAHPQTEAFGCFIPSRGAKQ